jgi:hypothetical protein
MTYYVIIFHVKIQLFVTAKSDQDPDPGPHWFGSLDPVQIQINSWGPDPDRIENNADTQHWFYDISLIIRKVIYCFIVLNVYFLVNYVYHMNGTHGT